MLLAIRGVAWAGLLSLEPDGSVRIVAECGDPSVARPLVPVSIGEAHDRSRQIRRRAMAGPWAESLDPRPTTGDPVPHPVVAFFPLRTEEGHPTSTVVALAGNSVASSLLDRVTALADVVDVLATPIAREFRGDGALER